jgi:hypothetical protein
MRAFWLHFYILEEQKGKKGLPSPLQPCHKGTNHLLEATPLDTVTMGIKFQCEIWKGHKH